MKTRRTVWTFSRSELPANETEPAMQRSKSTITEGGQSCDGEYDNPCFETSSCHSFGRDTEPLTKDSPKHKRIRSLSPSLWRFPEQVPSQSQEVEEERELGEEDRLTESPSYNSSDVDSNLSKSSIELSSDDTDDDDDDDDDLVGEEVLVIEESVM